MSWRLEKIYSISGKPTASQSPFTRYNRLSIRFFNRFGNRLYRVNGISAAAARWASLRDSLQYRSRNMAGSKNWQVIKVIWHRPHRRHTWTVQSYSPGQPNIQGSPPLTHATQHISMYRFRASLSLPTHRYSATLLEVTLLKFRQDLWWQKNTPGYQRC